MQNSLISLNPAVRSGKPCIRKLRITVYDILDMLASGMSYDEILEDYPKLTLEDIFAVLRYVADRERRTEVVQISA